jgi:hypothetical protein
MTTKEQRAEWRELAVSVSGTDTDVVAWKKLWVLRDAVIALCDELEKAGIEKPESLPFYDTQSADEWLKNNKGV